MADDTVRGRITAVQESRFRLLTADGRGYLFTLATDADADPTQLRQWHERDSLVLVAYRGLPGMDSCVASGVRRC